MFIKKNGSKGEIRYNARIVTGGHLHRKGIDFKETYAPVAKFVSLRILLTKLALNDWEGLQAVIVTAFLHGELQDEICMEPPGGVLPKYGKEYVLADGSRKKFDQDVSSNSFV